ncbi:MAG TPA: AIR synthase-related protein, partial [Pseudonocardiaceae bacterium]|nr:AIR synthase-related protein [Pseudonocardiaceae bacterium]
APVFALISHQGRIERAEMEQTFNMGVGMVALLSAEDSDRALAMLTARHVPAWVLGEVARTKDITDRLTGPDQRVLMHGDHPRF